MTDVNEARRQRVAVVADEILRLSGDDNLRVLFDAPEECERIMQSNEENYEHLMKMISYENVSDTESWILYGIPISVRKDNAREIAQLFETTTVRSRVHSDLMATNEYDREDVMQKYDVLVEYLKRIPEVYDELIREASGIINGFSGESGVGAYLREMQYGDERFIFNACLKNESSAPFENDAIVINETGIYLLEVKNYVKGSVHISKDGRYVHNGSSEDDGYNMMIQAERHKNEFAKLLVANGYPLEFRKNIHSIIVIPNNELELVNESDYCITRLSFLSSHIHDDHGPSLSKEDIDRIEGIIKDNQVEPAKHDLRTYKEINAIFELEKFGAMLKENRYFAQLINRSGLLSSKN